MIEPRGHCEYLQFFKKLNADVKGKVIYAGPCAFGVLYLVVASVV